MTIIASVNQLMSCVLADTSKHSHALIKEDDISAKLKKLTISDLNPNMTVLGLDEGRKVKKGRKKVMDCLSPLFDQNSGTDHNRACDAVLVWENQPGKCHIVYIDLKSDQPRNYKGQFQGASCFMRYIQVLLKEFFHQSMAIEFEKFIIFHTDSSNGVKTLKKTKSRFQPSTTTPEKPEKRLVHNGITVSCSDIIEMQKNQLT